MKCHKENRPLHIIAPGCNTAVSYWVKDQLRPLANTCKYRLQDANDVIFWLNSLNQKYAPFPPGMLSISFDVESMYPNITLDHGIRVIRRNFLDEDSEILSVECTIDAIKIVRTCFNIQFKGRHYIPIKGCNQGPTLRWMRLTNF